MKNNTHHKVETWFSSAELSGLSGLPSSAFRVREKAKSENWVNRKKEKGKGYEYHIDSLPFEAQIDLHAKWEKDNQEELTYNREALWDNFKRKTQKSQDKAQEKLMLLHQVLEVNATGVDMQNAFKQVAERNGISFRTMQNWYHGIGGKRGVKEYDKSDWLAALVPQYTGVTKLAYIDIEVWDFFKSDYLRNEAPPLTTSYRRAKRYADTHGFKIPSIKAVTRKVKREIPNKTLILKRESVEKLMASFPGQQRTVADIHALSWINGDGYLHNVFIKWPDGTIARPKTWFWQDIYSRKIIGWRTDQSEHTDVIRLSFGDIVEQYGIPDDVTIDNTRAAANKWMTGGVPNRYRFKIKEDDPLGLFPLLGIKVHWTSVNENGKGHGQAKPIERSFGVGGLGEEVDKHPKFAGAYTGTNTTTKPENYGKYAVDLETFKALLKSEINAWNAREGRRTEICDGTKSFDQAFDESYKVAKIKKATSVQRSLWLLTAEAVTVQRDSCVTLATGKAAGIGRNRYWHDDLHAHIGNKVVVRFDPANLHNSIEVYTLDGRHITTALCIEAVGFGDTEAARRHNRARKQWIRASKEAAKAQVRMTTEEVAAALPEYDAPTMSTSAIIEMMPKPNLGVTKPDSKKAQQELIAEIKIQNNSKRMSFKQVSQNLKDGKFVPEADLARYERHLQSDKAKFNKEFEALFGIENNDEQ